MLILSYLTLVSLLLNGIKTAVVGTNVNEAVDPTKIQAVPSLEGLQDDVLTHISGFLKCHPTELAQVNKRFHLFATVTFPYNQIVSIRYNIPEIMKSECFSDLKFFKNLRIRPDDVTKFFLIHNNLFNYGNFDGNSKHLALHLYNLSKTIPEAIKNYPARKLLFDEFMPNVLGTLIKEAAYDSIVKIIKDSPENFVEGVKLFNIEQARLLLKELDQDIPIILDHIESNESFAHALIMYLPLELYSKAAFESKTEYFEKALLSLLTTIPIEILQNYPVWKRIRRYLKASGKSDKDLSFILYNVRIKQFFEPKPADSQAAALEIFLAASISNRAELIAELLRKYKDEILEKMKLKKELVTPKALFDILPHLTVLQCDDLLEDEDEKLFRVLLSKSSICGICSFKSRSNRRQLTIKANPELISLGASKTINIFTLFCSFYLMELIDYFDEDSFTTFARDIKRDRKISSEFKDDPVILQKPEFIIKILNSERIQYYLEYFSTNFYRVQNETDLAQTLRGIPGNANSSIFPLTGGSTYLYLLSKFNTHEQFHLFEDNVQSTIKLMLDTLGQNVNYGEAREALIFLLEDEIGREEFKNFANIPLLRQLAQEKPEALREVRPDLFN